MLPKRIRQDRRTGLLYVLSCQRIFDNLGARLVFPEKPKNPAVPRVIIVMNTIHAPGGTHGSL